MVCYKNFLNSSLPVLTFCYLCLGMLLFFDCLLGILSLLRFHILLLKLSYCFLSISLFCQVMVFFLLIFQLHNSLLLRISLFLNCSILQTCSFLHCQYCFFHEIFFSVNICWVFV